MLEQIIAELKRYIEWEEDFDFTGWEDIEIFIGNTLSEAWIKARPHDREKFNNPCFRYRIDDNDVKWLEKENPDDSYKVLISTEYSTDPAKLAISLAHELRHVLDYQMAVEDLPFEQYQSGNQYYHHWSEFRAVSVSVRFEFYQMMTSMQVQDTETFAMFRILTKILGPWSADSVEEIIDTEMRDEHKYYPILYSLIRYIGAAHAIRKLNIKYKICNSLNFFHMTPAYIYKRFNPISFLSDVGYQMDRLKYCRLDQPFSREYELLIDKV